MRALTIGLLVLAAGVAAANDLAQYDLVISVVPNDRTLSVDAVVDLPRDQAGRTVEFLLTSGLQIKASSPKVERLKKAGAEGFQGINGSSVELSRQDGVSRYRVTLPDDSTQVTLTYQGKIDFALETQGEEYTRGFRETPGVIGEQGVYLAGSTLWYPYFSNDLVSFELHARVPDGWHLISQGDGSSRGDDGIADWDSAGPVDEIYLVGGPLTRYEASAGSALAEVYLRDPDASLANKYLEATARYIEMYRSLIGPYPYGKFALVENFWETGYGMPSFTLLGPQIIRFPFILTSSYPHEILHNWWGNSVFVDYETGNWCEGLTAYMADHLFKEQTGQGAEYRRDVLKKYRDFVKEDRDFPLSEFRSRHSAATEAVGYGKTMMGFHMLRNRFGDDVFRQTLANFYRKQRGNKASFADVRNEFETVAQADLERFFSEWVGMPGAADLEVTDVAVTRGGKGYLISGRLLQKQPQGPFELEIPVAITTTNGTALELIITGDASTRFEFTTRNPPMLLSIDPQFDVFRLLDARETAPSIGQVFGEPDIVAVLPSAASPERLDAWRGLVEVWSSPAQAIDIVMDDEISELPAD
ncbi:MAG: M1 family aminopeptidase, partial [Gammaproteobacteria bacterium]|nr:M1 family aminopeptidase [Gammaproteobacteria bacterium]